MVDTKLHEVRRSNVRRLVDERFDGNRAAFARHVDTAPNMVNMMLSENEKIRRGCGERLARKIEEKLNLPKLYLDELHTGETSDSPIEIKAKPVQKELTHLLADCTTPAYVVTASWLKSLPMGISKVDNLYVAQLKDACMEPDIPRGSRVIVDAGANAVSENGVYVLRLGTKFYVRRVLKQTSGKWALTGNTSMVLKDTLETMKGVKALGRIIACLPMPEVVQ